MSYLKIAKVVVDAITYHPTSSQQNKLWMHFNCWGVSGEPLIGLGGRLNEGIIIGLLGETRAVEELTYLLDETARRWIADYDDYASHPVVVHKVEVQRYKPQGAGLNVEFCRGADPVASSLLLAYNPEAGISHNYKRQITDAPMMEAVSADLERILAIADALALAVNRQRKIQRRKDVF